MNKTRSTINGILAILGIAATIWVYKDSQRVQSKELTITNFGGIDLLSSYPRFPKNILTVIYNGKPIGNYFVFSLHIENSGHTPIGIQDYAQPIKIYFTGVSKIISTEKYNSVPTDIPITSRIEDNVVIIEPCLLNPFDKIFMNIGVIATKDIKPEINRVTSRIVGIKAIRIKTSEDAWQETISKYKRDERLKLSVVIVIISLLVLLVIISNWAKLRELKMTIFRR